jgi:hypothetical protein
MFKPLTKLAFCATLATMSQAAYGQEVAATKSAPAPKVTGKIEVTEGLRPEYYTESGRYTDVTARASYKLSDKYSLGLKQGIREVETVEFPDTKSVYLLDPEVTLSAPAALKRGKLVVTPVLRAVVAPLQEASKRVGFQGSTALRLITQYKIDSIFSLTHLIDANEKYYAETLDSEGTPNRPHVLTNVIALEAAITERFSAGVTYMHIDSLPYSGRGGHKATYVINPELGYSVEKVGVFVGIETSNSELKNGQIRTVYLYEENLSEVYGRIEYTL